MNFKALFPPLPGVTATGAALFLEPIMGSGERLCVGLAAVLADNTYRVAPVLRRETARCLVGEKADSLLGLMQVGLDSLDSHLERGENLASWTPPMQGLTLGPLAQGHVEDLPMMLRAMARNHAFLATLAAFDATEQGEPSSDDEAEADIEWLKRVRHAVQTRRPALDGHFGRRIKLRNVRGETRIDYFGSRLAAQLCRLTPGASISRHVRTAKSKLWDLEALRDIGTDGVFRPASYELLIYRPRDDDPSYSERQIARLHDALSELEAAGDRQQLRVRPVQTVNDAASRIIEAEAA
ncbi:hypothetical protein [Thiococcus pfennigii]|uniref:hypothetical protein n=1 Tax=Thiococcus pfennigii TaxID=1057 RepID=UPI001905F96D|nr:hypothetical protein [Thiococcus pfennigii]MBK1699768.1 hypothetical protein [Thiococcus pfennigii]